MLYGDPARIPFLYCFGALWGFSAHFSDTLEEIRTKPQKGAKRGDFSPLAAHEILFRHYKTKLFLLATSKRQIFTFWGSASEKVNLFEIIARMIRGAARFWLLWAFSGRKWAFVRWSKKNANLNDLRGGVDPKRGDFRGLSSFSH